jgi:uncharacterized protein YcbX
MLPTTRKLHTRLSPLSRKHLSYVQPSIPPHTDCFLIFLVSGPTPFNEDDWTLLQIGAHKYHVCCRTTRCVLPTNDPDTGLITNKKPEPQKWLRANRNIDSGVDAGCLGMQMVPTKEAVGAIIRIGDVVKVLKRGEHYFVADASPDAQRPVS